MTMPHNNTRDFIGYGKNPPNPHWPNNARLALNIILNYEEGAEASVPDGDDFTEIGLTEVSSTNIQGRDLAAESMFEYGSRVGVWRLLRILQERDVPATVFACARALERNPQVCAEFVNAGYDFCSHGLRWTNIQQLSQDQEAAKIKQAVDLIKQMTGTAPQGWYCRYAPSVHTRRLLVEHGGFLYDSDSYADELPYWVQVDGQPHLVIPYTQVHNDNKFVRSGIATANDFFEFLRDSFDLLYEEGRTQPKMMSVGLHMRLMGHPGRALALIKFLDYVLEHESVWICRRADIAKHWRQKHLPST